jgi:hypothetical protein
MLLVEYCDELSGVVSILESCSKDPSKPKSPRLTQNEKIYKNCDQVLLWTFLVSVVF